MIISITSTNTKIIVLSGRSSGVKRDVIKIGENVYYQHKQNQGVQIGNQYSNVLSDMLSLIHI